MSKPPATPTSLPDSAAVCYTLDPATSEVRILVFKAGPLARVGHNHVLVSRDLEGALALGSARDGTALASAARVVLPVAGLIIDPPEARLEEGSAFTSTVSPEAREGTRGNLLGARVLDAERYPEVSMKLVSATGPEWAPDIVARIRIRDQTRDVPVSIGVTVGNGRLRAVGSFAVSHADFGMMPFSVLGGGLRVAEVIRIRLRLDFSEAAVAAIERCRAVLDPSADPG